MCDLDTIVLMLAAALLLLIAIAKEVGVFDLGYGDNEEDEGV